MPVDQLGWPIRQGGRVCDPRIATLLISFALILTGVLSPSPSQAQDFPLVVSPLRSDPDINGLNLATGLVKGPVLTLSIPADLHLKFDFIQNIAPYYFANLAVASGAAEAQDPGAGSYSIHLGTEISEAFTCGDIDQPCANGTSSGSTFAKVSGNPGKTYQQAGTGATYIFNDKL